MTRRSLFVVLGVTLAAWQLLWVPLYMLGVVIVVAATFCARGKSEAIYRWRKLV
ncbi:MAG: hypothetical protein L0H83_07325 [Salinisphaera sp.]|nr:hypothetical protein [Salinisphaera sp.]